MNLKKYYDAANEAEARVQQIAAQIDGLFDGGDTAKALELKPQLDGAKLDADKAHQLYLSMLNANNGGEDVGARFVPAQGVRVEKDEADQAFANTGEFFRAVKNAAVYPSREDPRLRSRKVKDATGMNEGVPADGGYLLDDPVAQPIVERMLATGDILGRVSSDQVSGNSMNYNGVDETTHVGSLYGGIVGYWMAEGGTKTASQPKFYQVGLKLKKIAALCYATDELLEDTTALASWLGRTVPNVLRFYAEDAIIEGDGVGKPLGIMNSPALVTTLRVDHTTLVLADILGMYSRRWKGVNDYVWLIGSGVSAALNAMTAATAPVYLPPGGLSAAPYGSLMGYPVIESEYCKALYDTGDVLLASLSQYQTITKSGGVQTASSIHVAFVTDETAFRFVYRIDGSPLWHSALTPLHGSNTVSPFVTCSSAST